ncbi:MAG TPA: gamma-glutamylcyclotransferase family protein [Burkholderiales bacterium]|nr:gamma-glutamylcyclotransferase family protein [Burkholderiales bacterium]
MPFYFAYGSNMDLNQLTERCPSAKFRHIAVVRGYQLSFTRFSQKRQCGVADLVPDRGGEVWGAVFEMSEADVVHLDRKEGVHLKPPAYQRITVKTLCPSSNEWLDAFTYEVVAKAADHVRPNASYMSLIVAGALRWNLPQQYIDKLKSVEVC